MHCCASDARPATRTRSAVTPSQSGRERKKPTVSPRSPKTTPASQKPQGQPDRTLFASAEKAEAALRASPTKRKSRSEWEKVATAYSAVVDRYPRSPYSDDALLARGTLLRDAARSLRVKNLFDDALSAYSLIVSEYPSSSLGEKALSATFEIRNDLGQKSLAQKTARNYLEAYPKGPRAKEMQKAAGASQRAKTDAIQSTEPARTAAVSRSSRDVQIQNLRFWSGPTSARVVLDLEKTVPIEYEPNADASRVAVDLLGARLHPNLIEKAFPVGPGLLKKIGLAPARNGARIAVEFDEAAEHSVFFLPSPDRLVIDVKGIPPATSVAAERSSATNTPTNTSAVARNAEPEREAIIEEPMTLPPQDTTPTSSNATPTPATEPTPRIDVVDEAPPRVTATVTPSSTPRTTTTPTPKPRPTPQTALATADATEPPAKNRDGSYSLARQLGLGARRICLDAGHGGHDPGAIGRQGAQEKDITLSIVLKLEKLIRSELGADVVLTRDRDVFIPLEERTAIANASGADLFVSVHINSARSPAGRGLETYYLSFAKNAAAEELAARENAISQATMKDLNMLVKAITTNSKIDESRDLASAIQQANVAGLSSSSYDVQDRGVHTAPFYVLIGAQMPSILTEVGFISNQTEEKWLRSSDYQDALAESILSGVKQYLGSLSRDKSTRLASREGERVSPKRKSQR